MQPERFLEQYGLWIGFGLGVFIAVFGLVMTVLERKLIVTRKAVVGYSGVNSTIVGGIIGVGCLYQITGSVPISAAYAAVLIAAHLLLCKVVEKKEYPEEERYTKE